jgi:hypothetical protein
MIREIQFGSLLDNQHDKFFSNSCQIEGNSEDCCINDRAGIQCRNLDSRLRENHDQPHFQFSH